MRLENKRSPAFTDLDRMPFGKYEGEPLQDVPASYLVWLWEEIKEKSGNYNHLFPNENTPKNITDYIKIANYIWNSQDAITEETGETIR